MGIGGLDALKDKGTQTVMVEVEDEMVDSTKMAEVLTMAGFKVVEVVPETGETWQKP